MSAASGRPQLTALKPIADFDWKHPRKIDRRLVDRRCHRAEIVQIEGDSYRLKEAKDRAARRAPRRLTCSCTTTRVMPAESVGIVRRQNYALPDRRSGA